MRILYVGNGNFKHRGTRYYDVGRKLYQGFIRNGHNVYMLSDRDTARASNVFSARKIGVNHCNRVFVETCYNFNPELIVLGHADIITAQSLAEARRILPRVRIAQFNVDPIFREINIDNINKKIPHVDATFITTAGPVLKRFSRAGAKVSYMPNPVDSSMEYPRCHERDDQQNDVFWALRAFNKYHPQDTRIEIPLFLERSGIKVDYYGMNGKPELMNYGYYAAISHARMGLNISVNRTWPDLPRANDEELYLYSSDRISHYMGSGLLVLAHDENRLADIFAADKEMVFFSSKEELAEKIAYYKQRPAQRQAIARAGWEKAHTQMNERLVAKYIVETTFGLDLSEAYAWPTETY